MDRIALIWLEFIHIITIIFPYFLFSLFFFQSGTYRIRAAAAAAAK